MYTIIFTKSSIFFFSGLSQMFQFCCPTCRTYNIISPSLLQSTCPTCRKFYEYQCTICRKYYKSLTSIYNHMSYEENRTKYTCPYCPYQSCRRKIIRQHMDHVHKPNAQPSSEIINNSMFMQQY